MRFGAIIQTLVLGAAVVFQLSDPKSSSAGDLDMVSREIYYSGGSVWVDDRLTVRASFAWRDAPVDQVFNEAREGKTNLLGDIQTIVKGEDLDVERYTVKTQKDFVDIHILSKVKFGDAQKPAKLRWVSSLGGQNITFQEGSIGRTKEGMEMLVFNGNGSPALWFPNLGAPRDEILADIDQHKEMWEFLNSVAAFRYVCRIRAGNLQETLFDWDQTTMPSNAPDGPSLLSMNSLRKLSLNDLYRLCTNFKVAKSGYYPIRVDNKSTESGSRAEPLPSGGGSGSNAQLSQHAPGSKIKIDGSFEDWKDYKVGWRESEGNKTDDIGDDIKLIDLFYCNDATCLYLFFRCKPTVQERYEKLQSGQMLGYLYVDSDSDRTTGATEIDASGDSRTLGADIQIPLRAGVFAYTSAEGTRKGCSVSYEVNRWDPATKAFSIRERDQDSIHGGLIAHGKDGVEMALLLPDLKKVKSNEFDFIYLEWSINTKGPARRIRMRID